MTKHVIKQNPSYKITVVMTHNDNTKMTKSYQQADKAAQHYAQFSTLNWEYGVRKRDPNYSFDWHRYHSYQDRLYRRALKVLKTFMK